MSELRLAHGAWVLVGDGEKAMVLVNSGDETLPNLKVEQVFEQDNPLNRDIGTDRPGRSFASVGSARSAMENADWHRLEKERFAKSIADTLYRLAHAGRFERLVVVAPPTVLGALRHSFHAEVRSRVVAEVDKDLTQHPVHEIERLLTRR